MRCPHRLAVLLVVLIALAAWPAAAFADGSIRNKQVGTVQPNGDIVLEHTITLPLRSYNALKEQTQGNTQMLLRQLGTATQSDVFADASATFDDQASSVIVRATLLGGMKVRGRRWFTAVADPELQDVVDQTATSILLVSVKPLDGGEVERTATKLVFPEGTTRIEWDPSSGRISCEMPPPPFDESGAVDVRVDVKVKPEIMSCFYKLYGKPQFTRLWVARALVDNRGTGLARDFRIRYRIAGYAPWSPWHSSSKLYPTQHVVAAYYPLFDHEVKNLKSETPSVLEVEWSYRGADGEPVAESDQRPITLLGMNDVVWSSMPFDDVTSWSEMFDNTPLVAATFISHEDPIVQQLVGLAARAGEGVGAHMSDQHTMHFVNALYNVMLANEIMYQSPPSLFKRGARQHVKYARDVMRNRAGTCVDLAILFASVCEAAGIPAYLVAVPGHAFPAFRLPSGKIIPFESTVVSPQPGRPAMSFGQALEIGDKTMTRYVEAGTIMVVDIREMRKLGVPTPELPDLPPDALTSWGIHGASSRDDPVEPPTQPVTPRAGNRVYQSTEGKFVLEVPAGWEMQEKPGRVMFGFDEGRGVVTVISDPRAHDDPAAFRDQKLKAVAESQHEFTVTGAEDGRHETFGAASHVEAMFIDEEGLRVRARYLFVLTGSRQMALAFLAQADRYDALWPAAQAALESFQIEDTPFRPVAMTTYEDPAKLYELHVPGGWRIDAEPTGVTGTSPDDTIACRVELREREGEEVGAFRATVKASLGETFDRWRETGESKTTLSGLDAFQVDGTTVNQGRTVRVRVLLASSEEVHWMLMLMAEARASADGAWQEITRRIVLREPTPLELGAVKNRSEDVTQGVPVGWRLRREGEDIVADAPQGDASIVCRVAERAFDDVGEYADDVLAAHRRRVGKAEVLLREADKDDPGILHVVVADERSGQRWWRLFSFRLSETRQVARVLIARADVAFKWNPVFERCVGAWEVR